jgi:branched-chain amino acid transport system substrate-binding protein
MHWKVLRSMILAALLLALIVSCGTTEPEPAAVEEGEVVSQTVTIGFTASQTGSLNVESTRQNNGLTLWMNQVNEAGGITLDDGTVITFDSKFYDDESNKDRVHELYTRLVTEDEADFLISPYSSGLADAAAVIAEQYGKVMITTGAASDDTYKKGYTLVFQAYTPASRYLTGAVDLLASVDPNLKKIAFVYENDRFSTSVVEAAKAYAESKGYEIVLYEGYDSGTQDFAPFINRVEAAAPEAILGGGHLQDGTTFARQLFEKNLPVSFVALLVAPPDPSFAELGDAARGIVGPSQWEPLARYTAEAAEAAGVEWYGPTAEEFISAYEAAYSEEPSYHSAGGYIAGLMLQKAIEDAGTIESPAVKEALDGMNMMTFYGVLRFDTSPEAHGLQLGHDMIYIQWQGETGDLTKQAVWPAEGATADTIYPIR